LILVYQKNLKTKKNNLNKKTKKNESINKKHVFQFHYLFNWKFNFVNFSCYFYLLIGKKILKLKNLIGKTILGG
jgi:hypothetical protein